MDLLQVVVLSVLQGLTEFLPISSSAHLILVPKLIHWNDQGLAFDVSVHVGTLLAVVLYFRRELQTMTVHWFASLTGKGMTAEALLAWAVLLGTIPVGLFGLLAKDWIELTLRSPLVIAGTTIGFGLLLAWAGWFGGRGRHEHEITWKDILIIGCAQALALIPGTSRSGITITAGMFCGFSPRAAARYSFLLSIPVIVLAGGLLTLDLIESSEPAHWPSLLLGVLLSGISAYLCIHAFLKLLERIGLWPFVVYRLVLGAFLLWFFW